MTEPVSPCGWDGLAHTESVPGWDEGTPEQQAVATAVGAYVVWALSGRRFGVCETTYRPPPVPRYQMCADVPAAGDRVTLPGPVVSVDEVRIDGAVIDPSQYLLLGSDLFGAEPWPLTQNQALPPTELGTWSVTYQRGVPVPSAGLWAAAILAGEILGCMRQVATRIPVRAQSVSREGVSFQMIDPEAFLENGRTGIPEVDMFLVSVNPHGLTTAPLVWTPDYDPSGLGVWQP